MALYVGDGEYRKSPNIRFYADIVYTNTPPAGAYRGYGVPQGFWPVERPSKPAQIKNSDPTLTRVQCRSYQSLRLADQEGKD
jgi:xanthine dehydrogenase molybdopterin-binding subunit B